MIETSGEGKRGIFDRKPRKCGGKSKHRGISYEQVCVLVARYHTKSTVSKVACFGMVIVSKGIMGRKLYEKNDCSI